MCFPVSLQGTQFEWRLEKPRSHSTPLRLAGALAVSVSGGGSVASLHLEKALRPGLMRSANVLLFPT